MGIAVGIKNVPIKCLYHHKITLYSSIWDHLHSQYVHNLLGIVLIN
jgi:hypothetical protein